MSHIHDRLAQDISLWLSGESVTDIADRAVAGLACDDEARRTAGTAVAIEDLVRDWYGGIPLPPPEPEFLRQKHRRSLISASLSAVAAGLVAAILIGGTGGPLERVIRAAEGWTTAGPRLPLEATSWWHLREQVERPQQTLAIR